MSRALRILHVSNFGYKPKGVYLHNISWKLTNGWIRAGHHVIPFSDRDVARWSGLMGHRKFGAGPANRALRDVARDMAPDVLALGHADVITPETVAAIREAAPSIKILQWTADLLTNPDTIERMTRKLAFIDATFATTSGAALAPFAGGGRIAGFMPNPVDKAVERARTFEQERVARDLFFAVSSAGLPRAVGDTRVAPETLAQHILERLPRLRPSFHGIGGAPALYGPAYEAALSSTRGGLNISFDNDLYLYSSDRLAHLAGNGLCVFIDRKTGYGDLFDEDAFAFFSSEEELLAQIERMLGDDARARGIAAKGWARYHALFDCEIVARYMIEALMGEHDPARYDWPTLYSP
ncbi:MAG: glycosyltransferase [Alphaproteobacteria bacterium]|nr:glycosyltransferase [Alphaproteobacteria bacterium]